MDNFLDSGHRGWRSVGDMRTGDNTEEFIVFGDIHAYLPPEQGADGGGDILLSILDDGKGIGAAAEPERPPQIGDREPVFGETTGPAQSATSIREEATAVTVS